MDRWRPSRWVLLWVVATVVGAVVLSVLWFGSDYANTSLRSTTTEPDQPADGTPPATVSSAWTSTTGPADPEPVEDATVVVGAAHGLRGLNPEDGAERWHYTRSTALLCGWTAADGVVVAVFRTDAGCDEALALDAGTGQRQWYRNVSLAADITLASTNQLTVASRPTGVTVFGTTDNGLRWRYRPPADCLISDTRPGDVGVAVTLDCQSAARLVLLDGFSGKERWTANLPVGPARLLTADGVVGVLALALTGSLQVFDREGVSLVALRESTLVVDDGAQPSALLIGDSLTVFTGSTLLAVNTQTDGIDWLVPALTAPAPLGPGVLVFDGTDFVQHDAATGAPLRRITVAGPSPPTGGELTLVGSSIVASTLDEVAVYR